MKTWTGFSVAFLLAIGSASGGCSDDGFAPEQGTESTTTGTVPTTIDTNNGQTTEPPPGETTEENDSLDETGPASSTMADDSIGTTTTEPGDTSTSTGSTSEPGTSSGGESDSTDTGSTTGPMNNPYEGSYDGTFGGVCGGGFPANGTLQFDVAADGTLMGSFTGADMGNLDGTVDDMGVVMASGMGAIAGICTFNGQIDMMGDVTGTWACPAFLCMGTWMGMEV